MLPPQDCFLCGANAGNALLCAACTADLPGLPDACCPVCALPSAGGTTCGSCLRHPPHFDATSARFRYAFPVDRLIQALKYRHHLAIAAFFSAAMRAPPSPSGRAGQVDMLLALPLAPQRFRERGFNQTIEIARLLAKHIGLALMLEGCDRTIDGIPQARLPWKERQKNIRGVFECELDLTGKSVVVVDDVMTTGATLNEFARTLKKHGAAWVGNWVVARAIKD